MVLFVSSVRRGFNFQLLSGDWDSVIFVFQGVLFFIIGIVNLLNRKYFIEWDDKKLRFLMPSSKTVEVIDFDQILSVNIRLFEIQLNLPDSVKVLDLNNLQFEDLRKIKEKFESLSITKK